MKKALFLGLMVFVSSAFAQMSYSMPALEAGFKWNSMDADGASSKQSLAFQLGGSMVVNMTPELGLRTGLFYSERTFKFDTNGTASDGKISYAEVPLHLMYKLEDYAGIYLGPSFSMKMSDECNATPRCDLVDVKSMIVPITLGAQFKFNSLLGLNLFFEMASGELAKGIKNSRALGINVLLTFD